MRELFPQLVRLGIGASSGTNLPNNVDWQRLQTIAEQQGLVGVALDGTDKLPLDRRPKKQDILQWIGVTLLEKETGFSDKMPVSVCSGRLFCGLDCKFA